MKQVLAAGPMAAAVALVVGAGVANGVLTDRWGPPGRLDQAVAGVDRVPGRFGEWAESDRPGRPIEDEALRLGGIKGYVHREYVNPQTRERVTVLLVCGRGLNISVHTPEQCYAGAGYRQVAPSRPETVEAGGRSNTFQVARFAPPGGVGRRQIEIWWAWTPDGQTWDAPGSPRRVYGRLPALYKLYVIRDVVPADAAAPAGPAAPANPTAAFLADALPALSAALAPAP